MAYLDLAYRAGVSGSFFLLSIVCTIYFFVEFPSCWMMGAKKAQAGLLDEVAAAEALGGGEIGEEPELTRGAGDVYL